MSGLWQEDGFIDLFVSCKNLEIMSIDHFVEKDIEENIKRLSVQWNNQFTFLK